MTVRKSRFRMLACAMPLLLLAGASAQSFNIDLDIMAGPPEAGAGAPSSTFGGAAGSVGFWNRVDAAGPRQPTPLASLDGVLTSVTTSEKKDFYVASYSPAGVMRANWPQRFARRSRVRRHALPEDCSTPESGANASFVVVDTTL